MLTMLLISSITLLITLIIKMISTILAKKNCISSKKELYECGFDPKGSSRIPFSLRSFLIAVIFLIFDVEMTLLPIASTLNLSNLFAWFLTSLTFLFILLFGFYYEWFQGALDWS